MYTLIGAFVFNLMIQTIFCLNFDRKVLNIGINDYPPFIIIFNENNCKKYQQRQVKCPFDGIEKRLLNIFELRFNFTSNFRQYAGRYERLDNGTLKGMINGLSKGDIDIGLGGFAIPPENYDSVDFLRPFWQDRFTFATTPIEPEQFVNQIVHPFNDEIWLSLILVFALFLLIDLLNWRLLSLSTSNPINRNNHQSCAWLCMKIALKQSFKHKGTLKSSQEIVLVIWMLSTLVLTSLYSARLNSTLIIPKSNVIDTIDKLVDACRSDRLTILSTARDFQSFKSLLKPKSSVDKCLEKIFLQKSGIEILVRKSIELSSNTYENDQKQQQSQRNRKPYHHNKKIWATFVPGERAHFYRHCYGEDSFYLPKFDTYSTFFPIWIALPIHKNLYPYRFEFNVIIERLTSTGIIRLWGRHITTIAKAKFQSLKLLQSFYQDEYAYNEDENSNYDELNSGTLNYDNDIDHDDNNNENVQLISSLMTFKYMNSIFIIYLLFMLMSIITFLVEILIYFIAINQSTLINQSINQLIN